MSVGSGRASCIRASFGESLTAPRNPPAMKEDLLHYAWRMRRFDPKDLRTTDGQPLQILSPGQHNDTHQGPDFSDARVRIGDTLWAGSVEIHVRASDWLRHGHQDDPRYRNVVLHVVFEADAEVADAHGQPLPTLELKGRLDETLLQRYYRLVHGDGWVPCARQLYAVPELVRTGWLERLVAERLESRAAHIESLLADTHSDWEEAFYRWLLRAWGTKVNASAFEWLGRAAPLRLLAHYRHAPLQVEALLFGQAGLLERRFDEHYPLALQREYRFLQKKHRLEPMPPGSWRFLRMRPSNFPTVRIAQLAALIVKVYPLFRRFAEAPDIGTIAGLLDLEVSAWWRTHYTFDAEARRPPGKPGKSFIELLVINGLAPFLFVYGGYRDDDRLRQRALEWLLELPPERNRLIRQWASVGWSARSAFESQGLIQLHNAWCSRMRCLQCAIGHALVKG